MVIIPVYLQYLWEKLASLIDQSLKIMIALLRKILEIMAIKYLQLILFNQEK